MKRLLLLLALLYANLGHAQETTIRILGVYPSQLSMVQADMTAQLQAIATAWNDSGLPGESVTTVQLLNSATAVPVSYPNLPGSNWDTAPVAYQNPALTALRNSYQADVIILFTNYADHCGVTNHAWVNGNFLPTTQGMDLRYRNSWYISVVTPTNCPTWVAPHEFGHLLGGGHAVTGDRLYSDSRAYLIYLTINIDPYGQIQLLYGTALVDPPSDATGVVDNFRLYSRSSDGFGDDDHENVRTLKTTARSAANYYEYPTAPQVLNPPINVIGYNLGCYDNYYTRHDLYWQNDPATNVPISHYEIWYEQPIGNPYVYGWTTYSAYTPSYVSGATARDRVKACSGQTCSAMSSYFYDAAPTCGF